MNKKKTKTKHTFRTSEIILLLLIGTFLISGIGWYTINVLIPQKQQMTREQNMRMWNSKGRQFLSRMSYCDDISDSKETAKISGYDNPKEENQNIAQKSCQKAKEQVSDILEWCAVDIPEQLKNEGLEQKDDNYLQKKDFVLNLCDVLQQSNFGQEK